MKILRIPFAVLWLAINIVFIGIVIGLPKTESRCNGVEANSNVCMDYRVHGWPKQIIEKTGRFKPIEENLHINAAVLGIFLIPSILTAITLGRLSARAHTRN